MDAPAILSSDLSSDHTRPLGLLALDSSTETLSVAVCKDTDVWSHTGPGGPRTSEQGLAQIQSLLSQAQLRMSELDALVLGIGPGSFTGLRSACAIALGLSMGARHDHALPVIALPSLWALAHEAHQLTHAPHITVAMDARMHEIYVAHFDFVHADAAETCLASAEPVAMPPEALNLSPIRLLIGNAASAYPEQLFQETSTWRTQTSHLQTPSARALLDLGRVFLQRGQHVQDPAHVAPLYVRNKVALTTAERLMRAHSDLAS